MIASRILGVPLFAKVASANLLIVITAVICVYIEQQHGSASVVRIMAIALAVSMMVNLGLVYLALLPLQALENTAARISAGDIDARVPHTALADRDVARIGTMLNELLDRLREDRERERRLAAQVLSAQDEERARMARELHDSTAQILTAVMLQLGAAARESTTGPLDVRIATMRTLVAEALEEVRTLSHTMHPRVLDDLGLAAALEWLTRQTRTQNSLDVRMATGDFPAVMSPVIASALYRVAQEALRNIVRHAHAGRVDVRLRVEGKTAILEIADNGAGFDVQNAEARRPGMGLFSMRERMGLVNGKLAVNSAPGEGTTIRASVHLRN